MEPFNPADLETSVLDILTDNYFTDEFEDTLAANGFHFDFSESVDVLAGMILSIVPDDVLSRAVTAALGGGVSSASVIYASIKHPEKVKGFLKGVVAVVDDTLNAAVNTVQEVTGHEPVEGVGQYMRKSHYYRRRQRYRG